MTNSLQSILCSGDMWSLGVLMYVVLTGAVPPFAQSMAHSGCRGMCADGLQDVVSTVLRKGLDSSRAMSPFPRAAQVRHLKPHNGPPSYLCCMLMR